MSDNATTYGVPKLVEVGQTYLTSRHRELVSVPTTDASFEAPVAAAGVFSFGLSGYDEFIKK